MMDPDERSSWARLGEEYNAPPRTPREAMWTEVSARIGAGGEEGDSRIVDPTSRRARRDRPVAPNAPLRRLTGWAVAAAAVLVLGIGIGRMSAPNAPVAQGGEASQAGAGGAGLGLAAREHLGRTESLLTMVRADARDGRIDPTVAGWAEDLLSQTRLLLDRPQGVDPDVRALLLDLELELVQVVGVAETGQDDPRGRTEVELTLRSLDQGEVLPRIQAALPRTMAGA